MKELNSKRRLLIVCLVIILVLIVLISGIVFIRGKNNYLYDEYKIYNLSNYLNINSYFYDGITDYLKDGDNSFRVSDMDSLDLNRLVGSYAITSVAPLVSDEIDKCRECYKYFSSDDNIRFYKASDIDNIYRDIFGSDMKRITQDDVVGFNTLYYNKDLDMYYINVSYTNMRPKVITKYKGYSYDKGVLYLDYYYGRISYDDEDNEKISICDMRDVNVLEVNYYDLFDSDNMIYDLDKYKNYFDIVRYVFNYDKNKKIYYLDSIILNYEVRESNYFSE